MRRTRLRKHRSNFQLFLLIGKVIMIWYLMVFSATYLTTNTSAYFTDVNDENVMIYAGFLELEAESSLAFIQNGNEIKSCEPVTLKTEIKNMGDGDMQSDFTYDVYYIETGNSEKLNLGEGEGSIKALKSGETTELTFKASEPGRYVFVAYQDDEHAEEETWSKSIKINCPPGQQTNSDENIEDKEETTKDNNEKQTSEDEKPDEDNAASKEVDESEKEENEENETNTEEKNTKEEGKNNDEDDSEEAESSNNTTTEEEGDEG